MTQLGVTHRMTQQHCRNTRSARARGFTMIELMVTVAIILILMTIVLFAVGHVSRSAKQNSTTLAMQNLQSLLSEFDTQTGLNTRPGAWAWWDASAAPGNIVTSALATSSGSDFWKVPCRVGGSPTGLPEPLAAPGSMSQDTNFAERNGSPAVVNSMAAMTFLMRSATNRQAVLNLPANQIFVPTWTGQTFAGPGGDGVLGTNDDGSQTVVYVAACHVKHIKKDGTTHYYASIASPAGVSPQALSDYNTADPDTTTWTDETTSPIHAPLILDGWNNPIIFVPASGLRVRLLNTKSANDPADATQTFVITSPDHRPFWASAGPDGDFSKGDDNLYSFEQ